MKKSSLISILLCLLILTCVPLIAFASDEESEAVFPILEDGVYYAEFHTDSSMFHANEACEEKGILTVKEGQAVFHVSLASKSIVNLYPGTAAEAKEDPENRLQPTEDPVTYSDGYTETVFGFDIPVPVIGKEFDLALTGKKGKWYDHKVSIDCPVLIPDATARTVGE